MLAAAWGQELTLRVSAQVAPDLCHIEGKLELREAPRGEITLVERLSQLPIPQDDLTLFRTFPGKPEQGSLTWVEIARHIWTFSTRLPRRFGALGCDPGQGLWANGGWLPQVLLDGVAPTARWMARVELPPGVSGALNNTAGEEVLRWAGIARRLSLAALKGARVQTLAPGVTLIDQGPRRPRRDRELEALLQSWPQAQLPERRLVIVETPDPRRLARPGEGLLYLSDQAFRLSPGLERFHRAGVAEGLYNAGLPFQDLQTRGLVAAALAEDQRLRDQEAVRALRWGSWIPVVDSLIYSGRAPFHAELFGEAYPGDPLADDLFEMLSPTLPGRALMVILDDLYGEDTSQVLAQKVLEGLSLAEAAQQLGLSPKVLGDWNRPAPTQDLTLSVRPPLGDAQAWTVTVRREAPADAPAQPLILEIDRQRQLWVTSPGPDERRWELDHAPRGVALDPDHHWKQQDLARDTWPARWTTVFSAYPTLINTTSRTFAGEAGLRLRRRYDTHNAYDLAVFAEEQTLLGGALFYTRYAGPLLDRRSRPQRLSVWTSVGLLSPAFRPTDKGRVAWDLGIGWAYDNRVYYSFPLQGARLSATLEGGLVPGAGQPWGSARAGALGLWSPHPRLVFAGRAIGGLAWGEVDHRLLALGGGSAMRGLAAGAAVGRSRALVSGELRYMPLRDLNLPLAWVYWLDEAQLTLGLEAGVVGLGTVAEAPEATPRSWGALGWTAGVLFTLDGLGAIPGQAGVTVGGPLWLSPDFPSQAPAQVLLRWGQEF